MRPHTLRSALSSRWGVAVCVALAAAAHVQARPFESNQNQYFAHAVDIPALRADWLISTTDPYRTFTAVARLLLDVGGTPAVMIASIAATVVGLCAVWVIARELGDAATASCTVLVFGLLSWTPPRTHTQLDALRAVHGFSGLAAQETLSKVGYLQPSTAGVLLLWSVALVWPTGLNGLSRRRGAAAIALACAAAALHPIYAVVSAVLIGAAVLAYGRHIWQHWAALACAPVIGIVALAANPALLTMSGGGGTERAALRDFAFVRIPHHTLATHWPHSDAWLVLAVAGAVTVLAVPRRLTWHARVLVIGMGVGMLGQAVVYGTRSTTLALLFPWRVSVILVPVAIIVVVNSVVGAARRHAPGLAAPLVLALALGAAASGAHTTIARQAPAKADAATAAVLAAAPIGTGLIPLASSDVRLNARVPVYVDFKSPPYAGPALVEWWKRVADVSTLKGDPSGLCDRDWGTGIDWVLLTPSQEASGCLAEWTVVTERGGWQVLARP